MNGNRTHLCDWLYIPLVLSNTTEIIIKNLCNKRQPLNIVSADVSDRAIKPIIYCLIHIASTQAREHAHETDAKIGFVSRKCVCFIFARHTIRQAQGERAKRSVRMRQCARASQWFQHGNRFQAMWIITLLWETQFFTNNRKIMTSTASRINDKSSDVRWCAECGVRCAYSAYYENEHSRKCDCTTRRQSSIKKHASNAKCVFIDMRALY